MRLTSHATQNILSSLSHQSIHHSHPSRLGLLNLNPTIFRSGQGENHHGRLFASQTLLSRTDFESKSIVELREELNKRGIVTGLRKKSILIDKILEDERKRMISNMSAKKVAPRKVVVNPSKETSPLTEGNPSAKSSPSTKLPEPVVSSTLKVSTPLTADGEIPKKEAPTQVTPPSTQENLNTSTKSSSSTTLPEPIVSSASKDTTRLMAEPDGEVPKRPKTQTGSDSSALASPAVNLKSAGHQAQYWPASINLPSTPVEEPLGTVIPFIPDNWTSHQQSHAPQLVDIRPGAAGLQVSTASHPSTLPEGGPSLVVTDQFASSNSTTTTTSGKISEKISGVKEQDLDQVIMAYLNSSSLKSLSGLTKRLYQSTSTTQEPFKFEDRPLNDHERRGLYQLFVFLGGSWVLAGILGD